MPNQSDETPSGMSESLGIVPGGFFDRLLKAQRPYPKCRVCNDTGYYFDNNGHGQLTWKRPCSCRGSADA